VSRPSSRLTAPAICCASLALVGCDLEYPEVVVVNQTADPILLKNPSFNGCVWNTVLAYGDATSPERCLPGEDHVHFQKLDVSTYGTTSDAGGNAGGETTSVLWFNYETVSVKKVGYGEFHRFEVTLDDLEQDFSVPGPYGH
jgi:hypothetical protein